jgi:predicted nucleic acid-binding protein
VEFLIDSNVFCRLVRPDDPQHPIARQAIDLLLQERHSLVLTQQVEREFGAVATRPREQNGLGLTATEARDQLAAFEKIGSFRPDSPTIHENWKRLVAQHQALGKKVHDAGHVAAMQAHAISNILSFNAGDFRRYEQIITVHTPEQVVAGHANKAKAAQPED